jgi:hypothetical protein
VTFWKAGFAVMSGAHGVQVVVLRCSIELVEQKNHPMIN